MTIDHAFSHPLASRARALVVLAGALALVYFVLPDGTGAEWIRVIAPAIGVGAVLIGIATYQPERTLPWALLAIALGCLAAQQCGVVDVVLRVATKRSRRSPTPSAWSRPILLVATATMLGHDTDRQGRAQWHRDDDREHRRRRRRVVDRDRAVPRATVTSRLGDHVWAASIPLLEAVALAIAHPHCDAGAVPVPLGDAGRGRTRRCSSLPTSRAARRNCATRSARAGCSTALSVAAPLVLAASALDPTMALTHRPTRSRRRSDSARVVWLSVAALTPLTVLFALDRHRPREPVDTDRAAPCVRSSWSCWPSPGCGGSSRESGS